MSHKVCPWWLIFIVDNFLRRALQNPKKFLSAYIKPGMTVIDIGCGMGFFTIPAAKLLEGNGEIFSVDMQKQMLELLEKKAKKAKVANLVKPILCKSDDLSLNTSADIAIACYVIHEVPSQESCFSQLKKNMKPKGKLILLEPKNHVSTQDFEKSLEIAKKVGFKYIDSPEFKFSHSALLEN